jgi:hypothetical protein
MSEQPNEKRAIEYRGVILEMANSDHRFWSVPDNRAKELHGVFTDLRSAHAAVDLYLKHKQELERTDPDPNGD